MGWPIHMELKGCESIECWTHVVTFKVHVTHDLDLGFSRSNFENAVSQECEERLIWNERNVSRWDVTPCLWLSTLTSTMTLTLDFQGQILKKSYLRNGMADWHGIKGMWVDRMLHPCCDFQLFPHPWPWPWIFKVKFWKSLVLWMGWPIDMERKVCESIEVRSGMADWHGMKGMWVDRMLDSHCDFKLWPHPWPWPWILKVKYWNLGMGGSTHLEWKGCELYMMLDEQWDWPFATLHGK